MFNFFIIAPLTNLVLLFYTVLGENLGLAIILFTICLRIVLLPLTMRQIRTQRKMAELQPRLQKLQSERKDASQMSAEEMALMRQTAGSCLGGCLPLLIQIPILIGLNTVISKIASATTGDVFNNLLYTDWLKHDAAYRFHTTFLGFDLAGIPKDIGINPHFIPYAILIVLLIVTQFYSSKLMMAMQKKPAAEPVKKKANEKKAKVNAKEAEKAQMQEDMQKMMQMQTTYFIPIAIGLASWSFTAALSIYWLTQNTFAIVQTIVQNKMMDAEKANQGGLSKRQREKGKEVEEKETVREVEYEDAPQPENDSSKTNRPKKNKSKKKNKKR